MNIETLKKIGESSIQVLTLVSLIVGIYLVIAEIRQSREIAALTLIHGKQLSELESQAIFGENLGIVLAKACHAPADLTDSEVIILDAYFGRLISRVSVNYNGANVGDFEKVHSALSDWKNRSAGYVMEIMAYPAGRHYLKTHPFWSSPGLADAGHEIAAYLQSWSIRQDTTALHCENRRDWVTP